MNQWFSCVCMHILQHWSFQMLTGYSQWKSWANPVDHQDGLGLPWYKG